MKFILCLTILVVFAQIVTSEFDVDSKIEPKYPTTRVRKPTRPATTLHGAPKAEIKIRDKVRDTTANFHK